MKNQSQTGSRNGAQKSGSPRLVCSDEVGWTSLRVQSFEHIGSLETYQTSISPDQFVSVVTKGRGYIEGFSDGSWRRAAYEPNSVGMISSGHTMKLRWRFQGPDAMEALHLFIPTHFFDETEDEYRSAASPFRQEPLDSLCFGDPVISRVVLSLAAAVRMGAPDLYAQSAGQFLAMHLLSIQNGWPDPAQDNRHPGVLGRNRLAHVVDFMKANYADPLSLDQLAAEAYVSRFHFVRLFKEGVGVAPHHFLIGLRMDAATALLVDTDQSIMDVALACGYRSAAHFTAAFQKHFSQTPVSYRRNSLFLRVV